jgi:diacylglycerol kinase (ATP)
VAILGGDGTASYAASGLIRSSNPLPLAVFPAGNGNDWVKTLRTNSIEKTVRGIGSGKTALMDTGLCSIESNPTSPADQIFINSAGIGLDAHVLEKSIRIRRKRSFGRLGYLAALVSSLIEMPSWEGTLTMDEQNVFTGKYLSITAGVCPFVGGGMILSPSSVPDDGKLDTAVVRPISRTNLIRSMPMIYRGTLLNNPSVSSWSGNEFRLEARGKLEVELDGESIGDIPDNAVAILKSLPASIRAVVGPEY